MPNTRAEVPTPKGKSIRPMAQRAHTARYARRIASTSEYGTQQGNVFLYIGLTSLATLRFIAQPDYSIDVLPLSNAILRVNVQL